MTKQFFIPASCPVPKVIEALNEKPKPDPVHEPKEDENGSYERDDSDRKFYHDCEINFLRNEY